jgi:hypothetical protein
MARRTLATDAFTRADENPLAGSWSTYSTLTNLQVVSNAVEAAAINTAVDNIQSHTVTLRMTNGPRSRLPLGSRARPMAPPRSGFDGPLPIP